MSMSSAEVEKGVEHGSIEHMLNFHVQDRILPWKCQLEELSSVKYIFHHGTRILAHWKKILVQKISIINEIEVLYTG